MWRRLSRGCLKTRVRALKARRAWIEVVAALKAWNSKAQDKAAKRP
jgi:hypothetical protein